MIPVGVSTLIVVHYYHPNSLELSFLLDFCRLCCLCMPQINMTYIHPVFLCTLHISNVTQSLSYKIWTKLNKILPESLFPNPFKDELDRLKCAATGANIHASAAMTPLDMSKIIFNPLSPFYLLQTQE
jgi:hypothetical protein